MQPARASDAEEAPEPGKRPACFSLRLRHDGVSRDRHPTPERTADLALGSMSGIPVREVACHNCSETLPSAEPRSAALDCEVSPALESAERVQHTERPHWTSASANIRITCTRPPELRDHAVLERGGGNPILGDVNGPREVRTGAGSARGRGRSTAQTMNTYTTPASTRARLSFDS